MFEVEVEIEGQTFIAKALERAADGDMRLIFDAVDDIRDFTERTAKLLAPKRTGALASEGISSEVELVTKDTVRMEVGLEKTPHYGILVHEGTGLFGSFHRPITPRHSNVLAFSIAGKQIFAKSVKGQEAQPFIREAVLIAENAYIPARLKLLGEQLSKF